MGLLEDPVRLEAYKQRQRELAILAVLARLDGKDFSLIHFCQYCRDHDVSPVDTGHWISIDLSFTAMVMAMHCCDKHLPELLMTGWELI